MAVIDSDCKMCHMTVINILTTQVVTWQSLI